MVAKEKKQNWETVLSQLFERGAIPDKIYRVLLYGPPGTGKSYFGESIFGRSGIERVTCHEQMVPEDLIGSRGLLAINGATQTTWEDGPATRAMRRGCLLVLDEIDKHSPELACVLHEVLDNRESAGLTLPTGERVVPADGFCVFGTMNAQPDTLPEALLQRFDLTVLADRPAEGAMRALPQSFAAMLARQYDRTESARWTPSVSWRSFRALCSLAEVIGQDEAAELIFGEQSTDILASVAVQKS